MLFNIRRDYGIIEFCVLVKPEMLLQGDGLDLSILFKRPGKSFAYIIKHHVFGAYEYPYPLVARGLRESVQYESSRMSVLS